MYIMCTNNLNVGTKRNVLPDFSALYRDAMSKEWDPGEEYIEGGANPSKLCLPQIFTKSSYIVKLNSAKDNPLMDCGCVGKTWRTQYHKKVARSKPKDRDGSPRNTWYVVLREAINTKKSQNCGLCPYLP